MRMFRLHSIREVACLASSPKNRLFTLGRSCPYSHSTFVLGVLLCYRFVTCPGKPEQMQHGASTHPPLDGDPLTLPARAGRGARSQRMCGRFVRRIPATVWTSLNFAIASVTRSLLYRSSSRCTHKDGSFASCGSSDPWTSGCLGRLSIAGRTSRTRSGVRVELSISATVRGRRATINGRPSAKLTISPLPRTRSSKIWNCRLTRACVGETMNAGEARGIYEQIVRSQRDPA